jgi:hypothetical protein
MPDDLLGLVEYLCSHRELAGSFRMEEFDRVWLVLDFVAAEVDRLRLSAIRTARAAGRSYGSMAPALNVAGRAGVEARVRRLESALVGGAKDERLTRALRAQEATVERARRERGDLVRSLALNLVALRHLLPDVDLGEEVGADVDDLVLGLREAPHGVDPSPMLVAQVKLILAWLSGQPVDEQLRGVVDAGALLLQG